MAGLRVKNYKKNIKKLVKRHRNNRRFYLSSPSKISTSSHCAFSVPASKEFSCPGETEACKDCYATKNRHTWAIVQTPMAKNWALFKRMESEEDPKVGGDMLAEVIPKKAKIFRVFESGDFSSQWSIEMWRQVIRLRKEVKFWAYTRSFHLNFAPLTKYPNFNLWASTDRYNIEEAKRFVKKHRKAGVKHAYGPWGKKDPAPKNSIFCPATTGKMDISGACEKCMFCVIKKATKRNIIFLSH